MNTLRKEGSKINNPYFHLIEEQIKTKVRIKTRGNKSIKLVTENQYGPTSTKKKQKKLN